MKTKIQLTFILLGVSAVVSMDNQRNNPYCSSQSCLEGSHTLCKFNSEQADNKCGTRVQLGLTSDEKTEIVNYHLTLKRTSDYERRKSLGGRAFARTYNSRTFIIEWDDELARAAQAWANQCEVTMDRCRNVVRFVVDQRVAVRILNGRTRLLFSNITDSWYKADPYTKFNSSSFEQIYNTRSMWESATSIGCGAVRSYDYPVALLYYVCNYAPLDYNLPTPE